MHDEGALVRRQVAVALEPLGAHAQGGVLHELRDDEAGLEALLHHEHVVRRAEGAREHLQHVLLALAEVLHLEELTDLDLGDAIGARDLLEGDPLRPLDRLGLVLHLDDPVAGDDLLGLGERAVDDHRLAAPELDLGTLRGRLEAGPVEHGAGLHQLLVVARHVGQLLLGRQHARLGPAVPLHDHHEPHPCSLSVGPERAGNSAPTPATNRGSRLRHAPLARLFHTVWIVSVM